MNDDMIEPLFAQLGSFAREILRIIDEGQTVTLEDVCKNIESGTIVEFVYTNCGFKNVNISLKTLSDVNGFLQNKYVSEHEAYNRGINNNGLVFIVHLIVEDFSSLLYNMHWNDVNPESYRTD